MKCQNLTCCSKIMILLKLCKPKILHSVLFSNIQGERKENIMLWIQIWYLFQYLKHENPPFRALGVVLEGQSNDEKYQTTYFMYYQTLR